MRLERCPTKCIAKLRAGECKRVPRAELGYLVGYYFGCPVCGVPVPVGRDDAVFEEHDGKLTVSPVRCTRCGSRFRVAADQVVVMERGTAHAR